MNGEVFVDELLKIVEDLNMNSIVLNRNGIFNSITPYSYMISKLKEQVPFTRDEIKQQAENIFNAVKVLPLLVKTVNYKSLCKSMVGSYGLKHVVEEILKTNYISNGDVILAMLYLKYEVGYPKENPINCYFNCKYVDSDRNIHYKDNTLKF